MCGDLGFSTAIATKWKNGSVPRSTTLLQIAQYFNVDVSYFEEKEKPPGSVPEGVDEIDAQILTIFSRLPDDKKQEARTYLEFLDQQGRKDS